MVGPEAKNKADWVIASDQTKYYPVYTDTNSVAICVLAVQGMCLTIRPA
jgi:hypothetical protein